MCRKGVKDRSSTSKPTSAITICEATAQFERTFIIMDWWRFNRLPRKAVLALLHLILQPVFFMPVLLKSRWVYMRRHPIFKLVRYVYNLQLQRASNTAEENAHIEWICNLCYEDCEVPSFRLTMVKARGTMLTAFTMPLNFGFQVWWS